MGWASGDEVFDPVARELIQVRGTREVKRRVLSVLIRQLRNRGWDTEGESLGLFAEDDAIVAAFRENGIVQNCGEEDGPDDADWCSLERGHDGDHADDLNHYWPRAETEAPVYPAPGSGIPGQPGYVVGECGHRIAGSEWQAGFRTCERCPNNEQDGGDPAPDVLAEVRAERAAQDAKWGEQNHPDGTGLTGDQYGAGHARKVCQEAAAGGTLAWRHILREEVNEAFAEVDPAKLREELVQVAAVCVAWIESIDRRPPGEVTS